MSALHAPPLAQSDAFAVFIRQNEALLYGLCYCLLHDAAAAEAIAQQVLAESYPRFTRVTAQELLGAACRHCLSSTVVLASPNGSGHSSCHVAGDNKLQSVLDQLTPENRAILLLHDRFGLPFDSIAVLLDMDVLRIRQGIYEARHTAAAELQRIAGIDSN